MRIYVSAYLICCKLNTGNHSVGHVAFNIFAIKVGNERRIPFEVAADSFYSESNMSVLEERAANIESGKSIPKEHELIEV